MPLVVDIATLTGRTLELLERWVPIRSSAGAAAALRLMAEDIADWLRTYLDARILETDTSADAPLVHARIDRGARRRILLYNMYDVMPASPHGWSVDPFRGAVADLPSFGQCYVGRGAENNKGPLAGMLVALEALLTADALDADLEILIEGEEESGSSALRRYLLDPATPVARCGTALFPCFCEYGGGPPRVYFGTKGILHGQLRVLGGTWGGPSRAIHSSNAPWISNPAWRLIKACSALAARNGTLGRVVLPPPMRPVLRRLAAVFDTEAELRFRATERYFLSGSPRELLESLLTAISINLSSLATDPAHAAAVIPSAAAARFDLRLPPGVGLEEALTELRHALGADAAPEVEVLVEYGYPGYRFGLDDAAAAALIRCYTQAGVPPQIWPWAVGAAPAHAFAAVADSFLVGGLGRGGNAHGVDEFVTTAGLERYVRFLLDWLPATAASLPRDSHERRSDRATR